MVTPGRGLVRAGMKVHSEPRLGLPTFLWTGERGRMTALVQGHRPEPVEAARIHMKEFAPLYRLAPSDVESLRVRSVHDTGRGAIIVSFFQQVDGIEVVPVRHLRDAVARALD